MVLKEAFTVLLNFPIISVAVYFWLRLGTQCTIPTHQTLKCQVHLQLKMLIRHFFGAGHFLLPVLLQVISSGNFGI